jgi:hypothetical protein
MSTCSTNVHMYLNPVLCPVQVLVGVLHGFLHGVLYHYLLAVLRIHDIFVRIRISVPLNKRSGVGSRSDSGPNLAIFFSDLQDGNKNYFSKVFCLLLFEDTFT